MLKSLEETVVMLFVVVVFTTAAMNYAMANLVLVVLDELKG